MERSGLFCITELIVSEEFNKQSGHKRIALPKLKQTRPLLYAGWRRLH